MYIVRPVTMETLWGDTRLHAYQGDRAAQTIGCVYTLSGIDGIDCEIYNEKEETTLRRAVKENPAVFGLEDGEEFPLIIAFDSCAQDVSFQIHPTDTYAKEQLQLPYGKSEAWYFIEKPSEGWVYAENKAGHRAAVEAALQKRDFHGVIDHIPVSENDLVYIRSGMMHALTAGSLIYEIQQSTNITYRLYDYERKDMHGHTRPLPACPKTELFRRKQLRPAGVLFATPHLIRQLYEYIFHRIRDIRGFRQSSGRYLYRVTGW